MYSKSQVSESSNYQLLMHRWQVMTFFWLRQPVVEKAFVTSYPPWYRKVLSSKEGLVGNLSHLFVNWIRDNVGYHSAGFSYGWSTGIVGNFKHQSIAIECQFYQIWSRWNTGSKWIHATLRWVIQYFWTRQWPTISLTWNCFTLHLKNWPGARGSCLDCRKCTNRNTWPALPSTKSIAALN